MIAYKKKMQALIVGVLLAVGSFFSCNDDSFLEEKIHQLTTETAYTTPEQIEMAIGYLHNRIQYLSFGRGPGYDYLPHGIGLDGFARVGDDAYITSDWEQMTSTNAYTQHWADNFSQMINYANNVIESCENETVKFNSDEQKNQLKAEGLFFRAFAHRCLVGMFGDWPILDRVYKESKLNFERVSRVEVWKFCKTDLEFAAQHLPVSTTEPGRIVRAAADHFLSEICISLGDHTGDKSLYAEAIKAASNVIDKKDGEYQLMTTRFGERANEEDKNVYWDLFRAGNFNYQNGNSEAIWVVQYDYDNAITGMGGAPGSQTSNRLLLEQTFLSNWYYNNRSITDENGEKVLVYGSGAIAFPDGSSSEIGNDQSGYAEWNTRSRPTNYFLYQVWNESGASDIRNSEVNIQRNMRQAGGELWSTVFQRLIDEGHSDWIIASDTIHHVYPRIWKFSTDQHVNADPKLYDADIYLIRLAETYLLRAEAYMKNGDLVNAKEDINIVRGRSNAVPVKENEIDMDYILDERMRELFGEEYRLITLTRLSSKENPVLVERVKKYGWNFPNLANRPNIQSHNWIYPVPQSIIDSNSEAVFTQNEGY